MYFVEFTSCCYSGRVRGVAVLLLWVWLGVMVVIMAMRRCGFFISSPSSGGRLEGSILMLGRGTH